ncbi:YfhO family protein [Parahaliea maris]|uniref:YfhO family protein n=1 Tax=Parahaliea maris TaxID=2716870 RepID=A0A5C9A9B6_9GAMM|nr:YfhO family protein [Parahaliea maris]TXS96654.1 YfhO family protein [Parahaliea maris]
MLQRIPVTRFGLLWAGLAALVITAACLPLLAYGPQAGHDLILLLPWAQHFAEQVLAGELYPRWLPGLYGGAGSPAFFYYPPLAFQISSLAVLACGSCSPLVQLGLAEWFVVLLSAGTFAWFARVHAPLPAVAVGALFYALAPYHIAMDLLFRQAFAEASSYIWIPVVFGAIDRLASKRGITLLAIGYALLLMTHLPTALLVSPFLALYSCSLAYNTRRKDLLLRAMAGGSLGLLLAAIYLLPALTLQDAVSMEKLWGEQYHYDRWLFFNNENLADKRPFLEAGMAALALLVVALPGLWFRPSGCQSCLLVFLALALTGCWFLMSTPSAWLWGMLEPLQRVQFPWRLLVMHDWVVSMAVTLCLGFALRNGRPVALVYSALVAVVAILLCGYFLYQQYQNHFAKQDDPRQQQRLEYVLATGYSASEYLPADLDIRVARFVAVAARAPLLAFDDGKGELTLEKQRSRELVVAAALEEPVELILKQFYYPGWTAVLEWPNGRVTNLPVRSHSRLRLLTLDLPAGDFELRLALRPGWQELLGRTLSVSGVLALGVLAYLGRRSRQLLDNNKGIQQ